ncbi:MAG: hypothetical protein M0R03_08770 [Novosphingobium sp.]|nr:hypothetical protein [Novosphingobium sp.]
MNFNEYSTLAIKTIQVNTTENPNELMDRITLINGIPLDAILIGYNEDGDPIYADGRTV